MSGRSTFDGFCPPRMFESDMSMFGESHINKMGALLPVVGLAEGLVGVVLCDSMDESVP